MRRLPVLILASALYAILSGPWPAKQFSAQAANAKALPCAQVLALEISPQPFPGAPVRADQEGCLRRLAEEATARAARSLLRQGLLKAECSTDPQRVTAPIHITGTVRLPISLPPELRGKRMEFRQGTFATAEVVATTPNGRVLARGQSTLSFGDVRWATGTRAYRPRPLDEVLVDFVRKSVDHAVKQLKGHDLLTAAEAQAEM